MIWVLLIVFVFLLFLFLRNLKRLNLSCVYLVDGAVKGGKSFLSVYACVVQYRKNLIKWYIVYPIRLILKKQVDKPCFYSNIPLRKVKYSPLTLDVIQRKVRIPNNSVVLIDEASLLADSMSFNDKIVNEQIMLFVKLFGHYSHGGTVVLNTQSIPDLHYNIKRCISKYLYIYKRVKLPFLSILKVRELINCEDNNGNVNVYNEDIESSFKNIYIPNKYYKYYDCYCYSSLTDHLPIYTDNRKLDKRKSLKTNKIISFKKFYTLKGEETNEIKKN